MTMIRSTRAMALWLTLFQPLLALAQSAAPQQPLWDAQGSWHMWHGWGFGWIFPLLMFVMMIACAAGFLRRPGGRRLHCGPWHGNHRPSHPADSALQILNERFARGEIQRQDYEEKKALILAQEQP